MHHKPVFIDLFAGCGGLSLGLLQAGWKGLFAIERSPDAFSTLRHNLVDGARFEYEWPEWLPKTEHDIDTFLNSYRENLASLRGSVDLIAGGPPCQGFSPAGKRNPDDPRNRLAEKYIEVVNLVRPKFLLMENVRGFNSAFTKAAGGGKSIPYSEIVKSRLEAIGYTVQAKVVRSVDFGVPQLRPRFILVATRKDIPVSDNPLERLHSMREMHLKSHGLPLHRRVTVRQAICDLEVNGKNLIETSDGGMRGFKQIVYESGDRKTSRFVRLMRKGCGAGFTPNCLRLPRHKPEVRERFAAILANCRRGVSLSQEDRDRFGLKKHSITPLSAELPSATITTLPDDILHYSEPRILTAREMARIQSFPDWFAFLGPYTTGGKLRKVTCPRYTQIGNAVPPLLATALGVTIKSYLETSESISRETAYANRQ